ncbi:unnamed protein product, partial [Larinioides sclopetarius]
NLLNNLNDPTFIFGDFNLHPLWEGKSQSALSENFFYWLNGSNFIILNTSAPTHIINASTCFILDLTLCSSSISNDIDCFVFDCTFESNQCTIVISWSKLQNTSRFIKTIKWDPTIKKSIEIFNTIKSPIIDAITNQISRTINIHTTRKILEDKEYLPWWNNACHVFSRLKKQAWIKARCHISNLDWINYKKYRGRRKELLGQISRKMHYCRFCDYSTFKTTHLKNHEAIHLGYKPFKCEMCSKSFVQKMQLQRHLLTHYKLS